MNRLALPDFKLKTYSIYSLVEAFVSSDKQAVVVNLDAYFYKMHVTQEEVWQPLFFDLSMRFVISSLFCLCILWIFVT